MFNRRKFAMNQLLPHKSFLGWQMSRGTRSSLSFIASVKHRVQTWSAAACAGGKQ